MIKGSYNADGAALMAEGGTARLEQAKGLIESLGGPLNQCTLFGGLTISSASAKCLMMQLQQQLPWLYHHLEPYQLASRLYSHQGGDIDAAAEKVKAQRIGHQEANPHKV